VKWKGRIWPLKDSGKEAGKGNGDSVVFILFLLLSFIFWYLNSLSEITATDIRYPVRYVNLPKDRTLVRDLPQKLDLFLKGPGYSILKLKVAGGRRPVVIDISSVNYMRVPGSRNLSYYVVYFGTDTQACGTAQVGMRDHSHQARYAFLCIRQDCKQEAGGEAFA
jgi:hypothetical protein